MKHVYFTSKDHNHSDEFYSGNCIVCDGGLGICKVCGCIEASLAKECPGFQCYETHGEAIYTGYIDFMDGHWVDGEFLCECGDVMRFDNYLSDRALSEYKCPSCGLTKQQGDL